MTNIRRMQMATAGVVSGYQFYAFGRNQFGQIGDGTTTNPTTIATFGTRADGWVDVTIGNSSMGIKDDGTLWTWGANATHGMLGLGDVTLRSSPVQVGSLVNWSKVGGGAVGGSQMGAIKTDGTLWMWGRATGGRLGNGDATTSQCSPVQVGSDTNWAKVSLGASHTMAIKTNGTLWTFGTGGSGQIGNGATSSVSTPVQVGTDTNWLNCVGGRNHTLALKSTGTIWTWGFQTNGLMANGSANYTKVSTPIQVGSTTTWASIGTGDGNSGGVLTDGTAWVWGHNGSGQLVDGTSTTRSNPVQIGSLTNWSKIDWGYQTFHALKTDGTIWAGGLNNYREAIPTEPKNGELSSPVQIGSDSNWSDIRGGHHSTMAVKAP